MVNCRSSDDSVGDGGCTGSISSGSRVSTAIAGGRCSTEDKSSVEGTGDVGSGETSGVDTLCK